MTPEQFDEARRLDLEVPGRGGPQLRPRRLDPETGKVLCLATGHSIAAVRRVHERAGHPVDESCELAIEAR